MGSLSLACRRSIYHSLLRRLRYRCCSAVVSVLLWAEVRTHTVGVKEDNVEVEDPSKSKEKEENLSSLLLSSVE